MEEVHLTASAKETKELAKKIAQKLEGGDTLCLYGELAAGKTTFTQGLGGYFGINRIVSPTYIILRQYKVDSPNIKTFNHLDLYRLSSHTETKSFDLDETWSDPNAVTVIEWPDRLEDHLPKNRYDINFEILSENNRRITITYFPSPKVGEGQGEV